MCWVFQQIWSSTHSSSRSRLPSRHKHLLGSRRRDASFTSPEMFGVAVLLLRAVLKASGPRMCPRGSCREVAARAFHGTLASIQIQVRLADIMHARSGVGVAASSAPSSSAASSPFECSALQKKPSQYESSAVHERQSGGQREGCMAARPSLGQRPRK